MLLAVLFAVVIGLAYVVWHRLAKPSIELSVVVAVALALCIALALVLALLGLPATPITHRSR